MILCPSQTDEIIASGKLNNSSYPYVALNDLNKKKSIVFQNIKNVIVGHLNINYLRNKYELLKPSIYNTFDITLISETKINSLFPKDV